MMRISIVRSVETSARARGCIEGISNSAITQSGKCQAQRIATAMQQNEYDIIHSSPLKRALDTAKLISQDLRMDIRIFPQLKEICYGNWEEKLLEEVRTSESWEIRSKEPYRFTHPGDYQGTPGQSYADLYERFDEYLDHLSTLEKSSVIVVTHIGIIRNAILHFEDCKPHEAASFTLNPDEIYTITRTNDNGIETNFENVSSSVPAEDYC